MPTTIVLYSLEEFQQQRGGCEFIDLNGRKLFWDGSQSFPHAGLPGEWNHVPPPDDPLSLYRLKEEFASHKLQIYKGTKHNLSVQAQWYASGVGPPPPPGWEAHLKGLADELNKLLDELVALQHKLPAHRKVSALAERRAEEKLHGRELISKLREMPDFVGMGRGLTDADLE